MTSLSAFIRPARAALRASPWSDSMDIIGGRILILLVGNRIEKGYVKVYDNVLEDAARRGDFLIHGHVGDVRDDRNITVVDLFSKLAQTQSRLKVVQKVGVIVNNRTHHDSLDTIDCVGCNVEVIADKR